MDRMHIDPDRKAKRIAEDIDMMNSPARWPDFVLHLKTQPWIEGKKKFGVMVRNWPADLRVFLKDDYGFSSGVVETFGSLEELAERWSVD
jgi:hypothetical protein